MGKNKLVVLFFIWTLGMILLVIFTQPVSRPKKIDRISFETTQSAEMYFKNVRSFYYRLYEEGAGAFDVYRLERIISDTSENKLPFALYNNWRDNLAFIRLDTNGLNRSAHLISTDVDFGVDTILYPTAYNEDQYTFAKNVYNALNDRRNIAFVSQENDTVWMGDSQRNAVKLTLQDYFRLIGKI